MTTDFTFRTMFESRLSAAARLVSGPTAQIVISPGAAAQLSHRNCAAERVSATPLGVAAGIVPNPSEPCTKSAGGSGELINFNEL